MMHAEWLMRTLTSLRSSAFLHQIWTSWRPISSKSTLSNCTGCTYNYKRADLKSASQRGIEPLRLVSSYIELHGHHRRPYRALTVSATLCSALTSPIKPGITLCCNLLSCTGSFHHTNSFDDSHSTADVPAALFRIDKDQYMKLNPQLAAGCFILFVSLLALSRSFTLCAPPVQPSKWPSCPSCSPSSGKPSLKSWLQDREVDHLCPE